MSDLIETASTGRAKCRRCQEKIEKGDLRFGERVPNPFGDGEATHWFHLLCAAEKRPQKLLAALATHDGQVAEREQIEAIAAEGDANPKLASIVQAERAPSGRASCQACHEKIGKGELRIATEREAEPMGGISATSFVHLKCGPSFFGRAGLLGKLERTSSELPPQDVEELRATLGAA